MRTTLSGVLIATVVFISACGNNQNDNNTPTPDMGMDTTKDMVIADQGKDQTSDQGTDQGKDQDKDLVDDGPVTFHKHVQPILHQHCTRCHFDGGQGPGDFTDPTVVDALADVMLKAVDDKRMPPPVADPDCRDYLSSERMVLPAEKRDTLAKWIEGGKQLGTPAPDAPTGPPAEAVLENPDLSLRLSQPYKPTYSDANNANNEYRCFALDPKHEKTFFITGMHPIVDQSAIVHHVVLAKSKRANLPNEVFEPNGMNCIDDMSALGNFGDGGGMIGAWAPGMEPVLLKDAGLKIEPGEVLVVQMHYYSNGDDTLVDQSGYALKTATEVKNEILMVPFGPTGFKIPANDESFETSDEASLPINITLWGVFPHMHVLGKSYNMQLKDDDNTCLLESDNYDFNNQLTYMYKEPLLIRKNTPIKFSCTWNNSMSNPALIHKPPIEVGYGERTDEEMCYAFSYVSLGVKR